MELSSYLEGGTEAKLEACSAGAQFADQNSVDQTKQEVEDEHGDDLVDDNDEGWLDVDSDTDLLPNNKEKCKR